MRAAYTILQDAVQLSSDRPVRGQPLRVVAPVLPHDHQFYELCLVRDGSTTHRTPDHSVVARRGHVMILSPRQVHAFDRPRGLDVVNVYYLSEWLMADLGSVWDHENLAALFLAQSLFPGGPRTNVVEFNLDENELAACLRETDDLCAECDRPSPSRTLLKGALFKLLVTLARAYSRQAEASERFAFRPEVRAMLQSIEVSIAGAEPLDLSSLGGLSGVTTDHLTRLFRRETGTSPTAYFQRRRVHRAAAMLLDSRHSVTAVAHALGYADAAHLSRLFRKHQGIAPRQYRAQFLKKP